MLEKTVKSETCTHCINNNLINNPFFYQLKPEAKKIVINTMIFIELTPGKRERIKQ